MESLETPCYIVDDKVLNNNVNKLLSALNNNFSSFIFSYSVKTNSLPWLLQYLNGVGCYAEVVSEDEYLLVKELGFSTEKIIYNGPLKSKKTFYDALSYGGIVNIDTKRELIWLSEFIQSNVLIAKIGLRVNVDMDALLEGSADYPDDSSRFGFSIENGEFQSAVDYLKLKNIRLSGLHIHRTTKNRSVEGYKALCSFAIDVVAKNDLDLDYIDIGGGFYGDKPNSPSYEDYFSAIKSVLSQYFDINKLLVIIEPGNAVVASCFNFLTTVIDTKKIKNHHIVIIDGSRNDIDPFFHKNSYSYKIYNGNNFDTSVEIVNRQVITGCSCLEFDRIFEIYNSMKLKPGDKILFQYVGAYTMTLSPLFIRFFPNVYLYKENKYSLIRPKWSCKSLILNS
ncbi:diaminopimelate decarboxylase [Treponema pedis]|uniref:Diaminopimelate decarboxylase n=1 Tax=Treponema pedis TaxID=409322 RepID=A0A7S6WRT5_9SPIR|nr:diaminopimelate decarboxylase [Treponema pedis]